VEKIRAHTTDRITLLPKQTHFCIFPHHNMGCHASKRMRRSRKAKDEKWREEIEWFATG
jgi:hypothetical protein